MRQITNHATAVLAVIPLLAGAQTYTFEHFTAPYLDLQNATSLNQGQSWDYVEVDVPIGFPFTMYNDISDVLYLYGGSGALRLEEPLLCYDQNGAIIGSMEMTSVFFCLGQEDSFMDRGWPSTSLSPVSYLLEGAVGYRILKIELSNVGFIAEYDALGSTPSFMNVQFWLYESDCSIELRFGDNVIQDPAMIYGSESGGLYGLQHWVCPFISDQSIWLVGGVAAPSTVTDQAETFIQGTPAAGTVYRFARVGGCGFTVGVPDARAVDRLVAYPNPTNGTVRIDLGPMATSRLVRLYNSTGALVDTGSSYGPSFLDIQLPGSPGVYMLQLVGPDGAMEQLRLIRE